MALEDWTDEFDVPAAAASTEATEAAGWTSTTPPVPGWYWVDYGGTGARPVYLRDEQLRAERTWVPGYARYAGPIAPPPAWSEEPPTEEDWYWCWEPGYSEPIRSYRTAAAIKRLRATFHPGRHWMRSPVPKPPAWPPEKGGGS